MKIFKSLWFNILFTVVAKKTVANVGGVSQTSSARFLASTCDKNSDTKTQSKMSAAAATPAPPVADNPTYTSGSSSVAFVTAPDEAIAKKIARGLVQNELAACVNIIPKIQSIYMWEGKVNEDEEYLMMIKTRTSRLDDLVKWVRENHPYSVAEVITLPIEKGNAPYLNWIAQTLNDNDNMPMIICTKCVMRMNIAYNFIRLAQTSEANLKGFLRKMTNDFDVVTKTVSAENVNTVSDEDDLLLYLLEEAFAADSEETKLHSNTQITAQIASKPMESVLSVEMAHISTKPGEDKVFVHLETEQYDDKFFNEEDETTSICEPNMDMNESNIYDEAAANRKPQKQKDPMALEYETKRCREDPLQPFPDVDVDGDEYDDDKQQGNDGYLKEFKAMLDENIECYDEYADENSAENASLYENTSMSQNNASEQPISAIESSFGTAFQMESSTQSKFLLTQSSTDELVDSHTTETTKGSTKAKKRRRCAERKFSFFCKVCHSDYSTKTNLTRHMVTHKNTRPFSCTECGKGFTQKGSLKQHMYTHTGEKPYICEVCQRGFTQCKSLIFHMRRHTGEKPFPCEKCGHSFRQKDGLKSHLLKHHMTAEQGSCTGLLMCVICKANLPTKHLLHMHMKKHINNHRINESQVCQNDAAFLKYIDEDGDILGDQVSLCEDNELDMATAHIVDVTGSSAREPNRTKKLQCRKCFKCFAIKKSFLRHLNIHQRQSPAYKTVEQSSDCPDMDFSSPNILMAQMLEDELLDNECG